MDTEAWLDVCHINPYIMESRTHVWMRFTNSYTRRLWTQAWPNLCHEGWRMNDSRTHTHTQIVDTEAWLDTPPAGTTFYIRVRDIFIWLILWVRDTFVCEIWGRDSIKCEMCSVAWYTACRCHILYESSWRIHMTNLMSSWHVCTWEMSSWLN